MPTAFRPTWFAVRPWFARSHRAPRRRAAAPLPPTFDDVAVPSGADADDVPRGCAWYVSSYELVCGTEVHEAVWDIGDVDGDVHELHWA